MTPINFVEADVADRATGCHGSPEGQLYSAEGLRIADDEAAEIFLTGVAIEAPNAGAGAYRQILARLGVKVYEVLDQTSSAGNWSFQTDEGIVFQNNRHPYHGFSYILDRIAIPEDL